MKTVFILIALLIASCKCGAVQAHECNPQKPKDPCAVKKPAPKRAPASIHPVVQKPVNDNDNENEQDQEQKQHQTVNVYNQAPAYRSVERRVIVEKSVTNEAYYNRIGFLLGVGPRYCCGDYDSNRILVGGAYYTRRIAGPFNLGVGALTNRTYFGMLGIDF